MASAKSLSKPEIRRVIERVQQAAGGDHNLLVSALATLASHSVSIPVSRNGVLVEGEHHPAGIDRVVVELGPVTVSEVIAVLCSVWPYCSPSYWRINVLALTALPEPSATWALPGTSVLRAELGADVGERWLEPNIFRPYWNWLSDGQALGLRAILGVFTLAAFRAMPLMRKYAKEGGCGENADRCAAIVVALRPFIEGATNVVSDPAIELLPCNEPSFVYLMALMAFGALSSIAERGVAAMKAGRGAVDRDVLLVCEEADRFLRLEEVAATFPKERVEADGIGPPLRLDLIGEFSWSIFS